MTHKYKEGDAIKVPSENNAHGTVVAERDEGDIKGYLVRLPWGQVWAQETDLTHG